jgi:hypothetical protein
LGRKIARLERAAGESLAKALAAGTDPAVAAAAGLALNAELAAAREQRKTLAAWAADASERRSRAATVANIAAEASDALAGSESVAAKQRVLEALSVTVTVTGWSVCESCLGTGRVPGAKGVICGDCHGMRRKTEIRLEGAIPAVTAGTSNAWPITLAAG